MMVVRLLIVKGLIGLPLKQFAINTVIPLAVMSFVSICPAILMYFMMPKSIISSIIQVAVVIPLTCVAMYYLGMTKQQRLQACQMIRNKFFKK